MKHDIDILVITHNRPVYTRLTLERLLATCDETMRVWIWQNGNDKETLDVVHSVANHPRLYKLQHSVENRLLIEPINWLWSKAEGQYLCKVDDDCLVPDGWAQKLRKAHQDVPEFGILACWHFQKEDFRYDLASKKIKMFRNGHQLLQNRWVQGSGVMMKRACLERGGLLTPKLEHTGYCIRLAKSGWVNGWYYPLIYMEHMDDPRSPHTRLKMDQDMKRYMPLTARNFGVDTIETWVQSIRQDAYIAQIANTNPKYYLGWRYRLNLLFRKLVGKR